LILIFNNILGIIGRDFCFVLQPLLPHELLTAGGIEGNDKMEPFTPEMDAERFGETVALNLPIFSSYGLGLEASVVHQLKTNWVKVINLKNSILNISLKSTKRNYFPGKRHRSIERHYSAASKCSTCKPKCCRSRKEEDYVRSRSPSPWTVLIYQAK